MAANFEGNAGNEGNEGNAGNAGNASSASGGWFFADRVELREMSTFDRIGDFPDPPEDLDLLKATPDQLILYGIPPRPDPDREHELYSVWLSFFSPRPTFVQEKVTTQSREFRVQTPRARQQRLMCHGPPDTKPAGTGAELT